MCFFSCAQGGALARQVEEMLDGILQQMSSGLLARVCTINCPIRSPGPLRPGPVGLGYDQAEPGRVTCTILLVTLSITITHSLALGLQLMSVLDASLSKLARYDEGTLKASFFALAVRTRERSITLCMQTMCI